MQFSYPPLRNDSVWASDEGHLTSKSALPVTQLNFGAADGRNGRLARYQLGPLYCSGAADGGSNRRRSKQIATTVWSGS